MPKKRLENTKHGSITVLSLNPEAMALYRAAKGKSKAFWNCICDCGHAFTAPTYDITKKPHLLCYACNFKSFHSWCIENNRLEYLNLWDYQLNDVSPQEISYGTEKAYYFKCPRGIHSSQLCNIHLLRLHKKISFCINCKSIAQWGIDYLGENFLEDYWSSMNTSDPWQVHAGTPEKVWIRCQKTTYHADYEVSAVNFTRHKSTCPACKNYSGKIHPNDSLGALHNLSIALWSNKNKSTPFDHSVGSGKDVYWKCPSGEHDDYLRSINTSVKCEFRCPQCVRQSDESILQSLVKSHILTNYNFTLVHERNCTLIPRNPKYKNNGRYDMPFDNEIIELKLIIEVHGTQHYEKQGFHEMQAKKLGKIQLFCLKNNY